jgi:hypothetical protein
MTPEVIASLSPPEAIPDYLKTLIRKVHNSISGHHGVKRTLRMLTTPASKDTKVTLIMKNIPFLG